MPNPNQQENLTMSENHPQNRKNLYKPYHLEIVRPVPEPQTTTLLLTKTNLSRGRDVSDSLFPRIAQANAFRKRENRCPGSKHAQFELVFKYFFFSKFYVRTHIFSHN